MINQYDKEFLIQCIQEGADIPQEYKYELFPTAQKEYELTYAGKMRKEDILSDTDEVSNVPLQIERVFLQGKSQVEPDEWNNMLIFGDNLQILKTFYYNTDSLIKDKVKGKIKLIYIDPPFATEKEYKGNKGQKAYSDKVRGAQFIEFLRRRLILMKELLSEDGSIFVHLDWKKAHYIKIVMDEIFGEQNFVNEIIWHYPDNFQGNVNGFATNHNSIFWYSKTSEYTANKVFVPLDKKTKRDKRIWSTELGKLVSARNEDGSLIYEEFTEKKADDVWSIGQSATTKVTSKEYIGYPTQKPEELLKRIILAASNEGDLVMDCFSGSGTTLAVAEKLNRRWIGCDIGKFALYTIQKRLLQINSSKDLINNKKLYQNLCRPFYVASAGLYDLSKVFSLSEDKYKSFVKNLFDIEQVTKKDINGVSIDGEKRGFFVKIYPYWDEKMRDADVDEEYVNDLHRNIGDRIKNRFYIVAPANNVAFINDYYEIEGIKYYFLKIPYQIIRELHNQNFKKIKQPQSQSQINDLDEAVGFHFMRQPEVESHLKKVEEDYYIELKKFISDYTFDEEGNEINNLESLSMVLIDADYNKEFIMGKFFFAKDLILPQNRKGKFQDVEEDIRAELKAFSSIRIPLGKSLGKKIMVIYVDIYGNEFKEVFDVEV